MANNWNTPDVSINPKREIIHMRGGDANAFK
jgi:hypothetical protein